MDKSASISKRIRRIASERGLGLESLSTKLDINNARLGALWNGSAVPEYKELAMLSRALDVDEAVLLNSFAEKLWLSLKKIGQLWRFQKLWLDLDSQTGQRRSDAFDSDEAQDYELIDALVLEDRKDRLYDPDDPPPWW